MKITIIDKKRKERGLEKMIMFNNICSFQNTSHPKRLPAKLCITKVELILPWKAPVGQLLFSYYNQHSLSKENEVLSNIISLRKSGYFSDFSPNF